MMRSISTLLVCGLWAAGTAHAAITADEAKALGSTLTLFGAEMAANKDGSIPAYSGGVQAPPNFKRGDGLRPDPFAADKPLLTITSQNLSDHAARLTEGTKGLFKKYPDYRMAVYPTHRSAAYPKWVLDNTVKNATRASTKAGGDAIEGAFGGVPFPIPKTGHEVMWNHLLHYQGGNTQYELQAYYMDASGKSVLSSQQDVRVDYKYYDPKLTHESYAGEIFQRLRALATGPARRVGEAILLVDNLNPAKKGRRAYQYLPGQRRVRLAPDLGFDTPLPGSGGASTYDDSFILNGSLERFDFKLVGKKEMFVPYNAYRMAYRARQDELMQPHFLNPDLVRWELHRVWVVEATLKPGQRHIYARRTFYVDEDSWSAVATETYDARGQLYRVGFNYVAPSYEVPGPTALMYGHYDLISGVYYISGLTAQTGGVRFVQSLPDKEWQPDILSTLGVR